VAGIGEVLRSVRIKWGLSLRDVKKRSLGLADEWGSRSYEVSGSWLCNAERGNFDITVPKLISLATIYSQAPEELLRHCLPAPPRSVPRSQFFGPNSTVLVSGGGLLDQEERNLLPEGFSSDPIPEDTTLLPLQADMVSTSMRRAVIGRKDRALFPMIRPGSVLKIDTRRKAIASPKEWTNEFDRPIYLLETRKGLVSGWCELDKDGQWLTLITHNLSRVVSERWRYRQDVEVIGRAVAAALRLTAFEEDSSRKSSQAQ
jgi:hypothetical protein